MAQYIKNADIFGRIGSGLGEGIGQTLNKEIERGRLAEGLQQLGKQKDLSPFERFSGLVSLPGTTPQIIQSGGDLLRQESYNRAQAAGSGQIKEPNRNGGIGVPGGGNAAIQGNQPTKIKGLDSSVTTRNPIEAELHPTIPPDYNERRSNAVENFQNNPARYDNNFQNALNEQDQIVKSNQERDVALEKQGLGERTVQSRLETALDKQGKLLGAVPANEGENPLIPGDTFNKIKNKAKNAVKSIADGGEGLTEEQAAEKYGKELDQTARDYQKLKTIGEFALINSSPKEHRQNLKDVGDRFRARDDQKNLAQKYISENKHSPKYAYYMAYPVSQVPALNNEIKKIPEEKQTQSFAKGYPEMTYPKDIDKKSLEASKKLLPLLGDGSVFSVMLELENKGLDGDVWLNYARQNKSKLNTDQLDEIENPVNRFPTMADIWVFKLLGLDDLVEINNE